MDAGADRELQRRSVALATAAGLLMILRALSANVYGFGEEWRAWLLAAATAAFGASAALCLPAVLDEDSTVRRFALGRDASRAFQWAFALFVIGVLLTAVGLVVDAVDVAVGDGTDR